VAFTATGACTVAGTTVHLTGAGSCALTASQAGNDDFNPAADVMQSFAIAKASQTITFAPLADRAFGADFTVSATASSGLPVLLSVGRSSRCSLTGVTVHMLGAGQCVLVASQPGNTDYAAAPSVTRSFAIVNTPGQIRGIDLRPRTGGSATLDVSLQTRGRTAALRGLLVYVGPHAPRRFFSSRLVAGVITAMGIAPDGRSAWIAGVALGGHTFRVYVEDNGRAGRTSPDVFKLWIDDALETGDGSLASGDVAISPGR
jgi:hypothetical protein